MSVSVCACAFDGTRSQRQIRVLLIGGCKKDARVACGGVWGDSHHGSPRYARLRVLAFRLAFLRGEQDGSHAKKRAASERTQCAFYARARSAKCVALNDSSAFRRNAQAALQRGIEIVLMGVVCWGMQKRRTRSVRGVWGDEVPPQKSAPRASARSALSTHERVARSA